jgi:CheY-like chemotaxis protein
MSPGRRTILVVDDDEDVLSLARTYLEGQGYNVLHAPNAAEGLRILQGAKVDLLFTDIVMPGEMDGFDLAEQARLACPGLRVLYTSGFLKELPGRGKLPADGAMLPKPWRLAHLDEAVKRAFG